MTALATRAAIWAMLLPPCSSMAQEAAPNMAITHGVIAQRTPERAPLAMPPPDLPATDAPPLTIQSSDMAALGNVKSHGGGLEWAGGAFRLAAMRARRASATTAAQSFEYRRFSMMAIVSDLTEAISARDTLSLSASYAAERRRPAFVVGPRRNHRTDERALAMRWTRDDRLDLTASLFDTGPARIRSPVERIADLSGGAPRSVRGWGMTASLDSPGEPGRFSVGVDFRDQQDRDIQHHDARVQISLKETF